MNRVFAIFILMFLLVASFGCSGSEENNSGTGDADSDGDGDGDSDSDGDGDSDSDGDSDIDGDADSDGDTDGDADDQCADFPWDVGTKPINLLVLLDRSKSMQNYTVDDGSTYAEVVQAAIDAIVLQHTQSGIINFALNVFPSPEMCDAEYGSQPAAQQAPEIQCQAASQFVKAENPFDPPMVPFAETIALDTYTAIQSVLGEVGNCGGTPMSRSLQWAKAYLDSLSLENDTYVLLATDGAPGCNPNIDFTNSDECKSASANPDVVPASPEMCLDDHDTARAVYELAQGGYKTFVVGVGKDVEVFSDVMDVIAYWGTHAATDEPDFNVIPDAPDGGTWYYPAGDAATLAAALEDVTNEAISCVYQVEWAGVPDVDPETSKEILKSCSKMRVFGLPAGGGDKVDIGYMEDCSDEDPESGKLGWTWEELEGKSWDEVKELNDTGACTNVKLCNKTCNKLKTKQGQKEWDGISATFGCQPIVIVE